MSPRKTSPGADLSSGSPELAREELVARLSALYFEADPKFHVLVQAAGLRPDADFRNRNLQSLNLRDAELDGYDFTGSDLRGSGLRFATLGKATKLDGALLDREDADWISGLETHDQFWDDELYRDLTRALATDQIEIVYQPILSVSAGMFRRVEGLARWRHPTRGLIAPSTFIPMLEERGQIEALGYVLLQKVVEDQLRFRNLGINIDISINMSGRSIANDAFVQDCMRILAGLKVRIRFEVGETDILIHRKAFSENMRLLRDFGVDIAVDNYGSGFSSFMELQRLGAQEMKIDRSLISVPLGEAHRARSVRLAIDLGRSLDMTVTAEGIQTDEDAALALGYGCDDLQGFWVQRPMPFDELVAFLHETTIVQSLEKLRRLPDLNKLFFA